MVRANSDRTHTGNSESRHDKQFLELCRTLPQVHVPVENARLLNPRRAETPSAQLEYKQERLSVRVKRPDMVAKIASSVYNKFRYTKVPDW